MLPEALRHHAASRSRVGGREANGLMLRGLVIAVYRPDERPTRTDLAESANPGVSCDVLVIDPGYRSIMHNVPILVQSGGLNDHEVWVPRAASISVTGTLAFDPRNASATPATDTDGDFVLVGFLANDLAQPVILGQLPHPRTNRRPSVNDATLDRWRRALRGNEISISETGAVLADFSGQSAGTVDPFGNEISVGGGAVTLVFGEGGVLTIQLANGGSIVVTDEGDTEITLAGLAKFTVTAGGTVEAVILGQTYLGDVQDSLDELYGATGLITALLGGTPPPVTAAHIVKIAASLAVLAPYLSARTETE